MKKLLLAAALAGAIAVAYGSMLAEKKDQPVKKTEKKCGYKSSYHKSI